MSPSQPATHDPAPRAPLPWRFLPLVAVALVVASAVFRIGGPDVWWHVRQGRWIAETGRLPDPDPFSHTAPGPVRYTEDLADRLFHAVHAADGADGLLALKLMLVALWAGGVAWVAWGVAAAGSPARVRLLAVFVTTVLFGLGVQFRLAIKPFLFSYLGTTAVMLVLLAAQRSPRRRHLLWSLPPLFLLWGHLHRGGTLGLFFLGTATLAWTWERRRELWLPAWSALVLSAGALTLNSAGVHYFGMGASLALAEELAAYLPEWSRWTPRLALVTFPWFTALLVGWAVARWRTGGPWFELGWVAGTVLLAGLAVRFQPYAVLAMVPGLARGASALGEAVRTRRARSLPGLALATVLVSAVAMHAEYRRQRPPDQRGTGVHWSVPVDVAGFLQADPPPGRMWNAFPLGGYLLYALAPQQKVFIDGRNDTVYPREFFAEHVRSAFDPALLQRHLDEYGITYAVVDDGGPGDPRYEALHRSPDWALVYWDDVASVLVRRTAETQEYLARHAYRQLRVPTTMERMKAWPTDPFRDELALDVIRNAREAPHSMRALFALADLHRHRGERAAFDAAWQALREEALRRGLPPPGGAR